MNNDISIKLDNLIERMDKMICLIEELKDIIDKKDKTYQEMYDDYRKSYEKSITDVDEDENNQVAIVIN